MGKMRFDKDYIYYDDKGNLHSPQEKGTHHAFLPYEIEKLYALAKLIRGLKAFRLDEWDLFLECEKDEFVIYRTAKRLGISYHKIDNLIKRVSRIGKPK